jgi:chaperonin GroES
MTRAVIAGMKPAQRGLTGPEPNLGCARVYCRFRRGHIRRVMHGGKTRMSIRPLQDRILLKRLREEEKTKGGIIIPDTAKEKPQEGKVVAVGNGAILKDGTVRKLEVKKGDTVLFAKYSGNEVLLDGEEHLIMREEDILAILEK